ncbi:MAG: TatD family hydrolase [Mangrovibacterium sp.]
MKIINFHTHSILKGNILGFVNHSVTNPFNPVFEQIYSVGLHPWDILKTENDWCSKIEETLTDKQVQALGECGIDFAIDTPINVQYEVFERHIELSSRYNLPLIIHAVKSYSELIHFSKKHNASQPWIIHGYNGNIQTTHQLLHHNFMFSIGDNLRFKKDWNNIINLIPLNRLFVETDNSDIDIEILYEKIAYILKIEIDELKTQVYQNYINLLK